MNQEQRAGKTLAYLGYVFQKQSDRSTNILDRAMLESGRAACAILARLIAEDRVNEDWRWLAEIDAPDVPDEPTKKQHKPFRPYADSYSDWKYETRDDSDEEIA